MTATMKLDPTLWKQGYRAAIMDVFYGAPLIAAASNPRGLAHDFVCGALAASERCAELETFRETDPLEWTRIFGNNAPVDWAMADAHASVEASMAWYIHLINQHDSDIERAEAAAEERYADDTDYEALAVELGEGEVRGA